MPPLPSRSPLLDLTRELIDTFELMGNLARRIHEELMAALAATQEDQTQNLPEQAHYISPPQFRFQFRESRNCEADRINAEEAAHERLVLTGSDGRSNSDEDFQASEEVVILRWRGANKEDVPTALEVDANRSQVEQRYYQACYPTSKFFSLDEIEGFTKMTEAHQIFKAREEADKIGNSLAEPDVLSPLTGRWVEHIFMRSWRREDTSQSGVNYGIFLWMFQVLARDMMLIDSKKLASRQPSIHWEEDPDCAICHNPLAEGSAQVEVGVCSHRFHRACLKTWLQMNPTNSKCPMCRGQITELYLPLWRKMVDPPMLRDGTKSPAGGFMVFTWFTGIGWRSLSWRFSLPNRDTNSYWDLVVVPMEAEGEAFPEMSLGLEWKRADYERVHDGMGTWVAGHYAENWDPITRTLK